MMQFAHGGRGCRRAQRGAVVGTSWCAIAANAPIWCRSELTPLPNGCRLVQVRAEQPGQAVLVEDGHVELLCLRELAAGVGTGDEESGFFNNKGQLTRVEGMAESLEMSAQAVGSAEPEVVLEDRSGGRLLKLTSPS